MDAPQVTGATAASSATATTSQNVAKVPLSSQAHTIKEMREAPIFLKK